MNFLSFKKKYLFQITLLIFVLFFQQARSLENKDDNKISVGREDAPVKIILYSSLTCPHCADFHKQVYPLIKEKYVDKGQVQVIFKDFPLDLPALNAAKLLQCVDDNKKLILLDKIYETQRKWTVGNEIEEINKNLFSIMSEFGLSNKKLNGCLENEEIEENILNSRVDAQKKYKIDSTPTVIINQKKLKGPTSFENIESVIKKII